MDFGCWSTVPLADRKLAYEASGFNLVDEPPCMDTVLMGVLTDVPVGTLKSEVRDRTSAFGLAGFAMLPTFPGERVYDGFYSEWPRDVRAQRHGIDVNVISWASLDVGA